MLYSGARAPQNVLLQAVKIMIFPDYTARVQQQRKSFTAVKVKMQAMQMKYTFLYPARLKAIHQGKMHFFDTAEEALTVLEELPRLTDGQRIRCLRDCPPP